MMIECTSFVGGQHIRMPNPIDCVRVWFGINWLGATYVPINTAYKGKLLEHQGNRVKEVVTKA